MPGTTTTLFASPIILAAAITLMCVASLVGLVAVM